MRSREAEIGLICAAEPSWRPRSAQEAPEIARADGLDALGAPKKYTWRPWEAQKKVSWRFFSFPRALQGVLGGSSRVSWEVFWQEFCSKQLGGQETLKICVFYCLRRVFFDVNFLFVAGPFFRMILHRRTSKIIKIHWFLHVFQQCRTFATHAKFMKSTYKNHAKSVLEMHAKSTAISSRRSIQKYAKIEPKCFLGGPFLASRACRTALCAQIGAKSVPNVSSEASGGEKKLHQRARESPKQAWAF